MHAFRHFPHCLFFASQSFPQHVYKTIFSARFFLYSKAFTLHFSVDKNVSKPIKKVDIHIAKYLAAKVSTLSTPYISHPTFFNLLYPKEKRK